MSRLRISAISFLNTAPLMWDFEHGERAAEPRKEFEIRYTVPSLCAEALRRGEADIGIIPAITYQTIPDLVIIPNVAIAARGPVRSILLISKIPIPQIRSVAVDTSSRTSVALLQILFRNGWLQPETKSETTQEKSQITNHKSQIAEHDLPHFVPCAPDLPQMLSAHDAALLIGDSALRVDRSQYHVVDLAEAWQRATGKPFVFAFWAVRQAALKDHPDAGRIAAIFQQSRDHGLEHSEDIAAQWAPRVGINAASAAEYLRQSISYMLDADALAGLGEFFALAQQFAMIPENKPLEFINGSRAAQPAR